MSNVEIFIDLLWQDFVNTKKELLLAQTELKEKDQIIKDKDTEILKLNDEKLNWMNAKNDAERGWNVCKQTVCDLEKKNDELSKVIMDLNARIINLTSTENDFEWVEEEARRPIRY